ncbi:hypothetical protein V8C86DRAFT_2527290 [Haematococcus lacustris]
MLPVWTEVALVLPGCALVIVCAAPPLHLRLRSLCCPWLHATVEAQLPLVARVQQTWRSKLLDILVKAAAVTVTVEFYLIGLPILYWLGAHDGCQLLVGCLALTTWVTCALKDTLCGPRPLHAQKLRALRIAPTPPLPSCPAPAGFAPHTPTEPEQQLSSQHSCLGGTGAQPTGALAWPPAPLTGTGAGLPADTHSAEDAGEGAGSWGVTPGVQPAGGSADQAAARLLQGRQEPGRGGVQPVSACAAPSATPGLEQGGQAEGTVQVLEPPRDVEYGAPSMHLSLALVMQGTAAHLAACALTARWGWEQHSPAAWALHASLGALALAWAALIAWSRLYLGVHTPVDLALGAATGGSVLALWRRLGPCWLAWLKSASPSQCAAYLLLHGLLLALYPRPKAHTSSYVYACTFLGAQAGLSLADSPAWAEHPTSLQLAALLRSLLRSLLPSTALQFLASPAQPASLLHHPLHLAVKLAWGLANVLLLRSLAKALLSKALPVLMGAAPDWLRQAWQPPVCEESEKSDLADSMAHELGLLRGGGVGSMEGQAAGHPSGPSAALVSYSSGSTDAQASVFLAAKQLGQHHSEGSCCSSTDLMRGGGWGGEQQEAGPGSEAGWVGVARGGDVRQGSCMVVGGGAAGLRQRKQQGSGSSQQPGGSLSSQSSSTVCVQQVPQSQQQQAGAELVHEVKARVELGGGEQQAGRQKGVLWRAGGKGAWDVYVVQTYLSYFIAVSSIAHFERFLDSLNV